MTAAEISALVNRLLFAGPLLYIGLAIVMDTPKFLRGLQNFSRFVQAFEQRLRGTYGIAPLAESSMDDGGPQMLRAALQLVGCFVVAMAVLCLLGVGA